MSSQRSRIALAVALTVAFYGLAIGLALGLIALPFIGFAVLDRGNLWVTVALIAAGVAILRAIIPERARFTAPGPELTAAEQPRLRALLDEVAVAAGDRPVDAVYLDLDLNAAVLEHRRQRIMLLGLPLLTTLGEDELRAVVAHEHGHYVGGDTRFSRWIWRTRAAAIKTAQAMRQSDSFLRRSILYWPFYGYALGFLRITNAVSRRQEFAADALSASVAGAPAAGRTLRRVEAVAPLWNAYWSQDVVPMLEAKRRPPVALGFSQMLSGRTATAALEEIVASDTVGGEPDPYASHPTLGQRLEALGVAVESAAPPAPERPASDLVSDIADLEQRLLRTNFGDEVARFQPADWKEAPGVHRERMAAMVADFGPVLGEATVAGAAALAMDVKALREQMRAGLGTDEHVPGETLDAIALSVIAAAVTCAAADAGAVLSAPPGEPVHIHADGSALNPGPLLQAIADGEQDVEAWTGDPVVAAYGSAPLRTAEVAGPFTGGA